VITIILLALEIATILFDVQNNSALIIPNRIANVLGFSLSPAVPFILLLFSIKEDKETVSMKLIKVPLIVNALICVLSYKTGWIFYVNSQNYYVRGYLFILPTIISLLYYLLTIIAVIKNRDEYETGDRKALLAIIFIPIIATLFQIIFKNLIIIWNGAALCLLLYYIFLRELQFTYDIQTGVKNRAAFEREMERYSNYNKNVAIILFDLNQLKETNDEFGHKIGDELLVNAAKAIKDCFYGIGKTYRIGGDEFCAICEEAPTELIVHSLAALDDLLDRVNQNRKNKIVLAYGYAFYNIKASESIYSAFSKADKAMYKHKAKLKEAK
jgi:diguanylate cyclase (GGDEF)-like protein